MATIYKSNQFKELAERLGRNDTKIAGKKVFQTYMHLVIFAAMVGYCEKSSHAVKERGPEVEDGVFTRHNQDGLVYLIGLDNEKDGDVLSEVRETECWRTIESYAEGGFRIIEQWLLDRPSDTDGVETILARMIEVASEKVKEDTEQLTPEVIF